MSPRRPSAPRQQYSERAAAYVRAMVISGEMPPGSQVRVEQVAEALGISTTPAREALQLLKVEGFVKAVQNKGFMVAPLTGQDIRDLFRVQGLLGGELAARATRNAAPRDLAELEALHLELMAAAAREHHEALEAKNHEFHRQINRLADSGKMLWVLGLTTRYVPRMFYASIPGWPETTMEDHGEILAAMKAGDPEQARAVMEAHLRHAGEKLADYFDARLAGESTQPE
ncbi:GntR family transcriptional regulator [Micrococcales bacterium 31B]|nr:GntR family transcriptional regulator [Micrococcales bacterium 31B]